MALETGIDAKQIEALKETVRSWAGDPVQLRFVVCVALMLIGVFAVERPLSARLASAREAYTVAEEKSEMASAVDFYRTELDKIEWRAAVEPDLTDWQTYVLTKLRETTSAQLLSIEPRKPINKGPFKVMDMELSAQGPSYTEFTNFIHALERGDRLVRVERCRIERQRGEVSLTCSIRGLVKPGASAAGRPPDEDLSEAGVDELLDELAPGEVSGETDGDVPGEASETDAAAMPAAPATPTEDTDR